MQLLVNGEPKNFDSAQSLSEVLQQLGYRGDTFAVAVNGDFVPRATYEQTALNPGDSLDIVAPVVGG
ncbi:sulfur carrier protein ThiS [Microbulbifer elongatus]|uniref:Sulfur carrier protein ThiS n=1 Tax=Microbulbifer elongatus TaxID=86173 RepID=A0ABT1NVF8_9GAMM|nr:sulfur carrier protein ThiS [Microbulbifer elongatus]MCQ3827890.1 sulfur carrier protein ThiS [Microbulbifer elongatus]